MLATIRIGTVADIDAAASIWERAHHEHDDFQSEPARKDRALSFLASRATLPDAEFFVAEFDAEIVGMLFAVQAREHDGEGDPIPRLAHVSYVAVEPAHWGHGIATKLLDQFVCQAQKKGYERLQLWVETRNERARMIYEHFGFTCSGREKPDDRARRTTHYEMQLGPSAGA